MKIAFYNLDRNAGIEALKQRLREKGANLACFGEDFDSWRNLPADTELFLSLGGDGTFLHALTFVRDRGIPVAGINFGRLGFLTTARADESGSWIDDLLAGRFLVEERSLLHVDCPGLPADAYPFALNEVSLQRLGAGMISIHIRIDGKAIPTYWADGLVISTPTGSTAYSLSVGGPIVMPDSDVLVIAPIAPHNLNVRPLVVPLGSEIEMDFDARDGQATLALDNRSCPVGAGAKIRLSRGGHGLRYVSLSDNSFIAALRSKLLWGEDRRNTL